MNLQRAALGLWLAVLVGVMIPSVSSQAWTHDRGGGYIRLGAQALRADHFYDPGGQRIPITTVGDYVVSLYGEYGITTALTAVVYAPFFERVTLNSVVDPRTGTAIVEGDAVNGIADATVGVRYGLLREGPLVASLGLHLGLPLGDDSQVNGLVTGDGEFNQHAVLALGYSFYPRTVYLQASTGFNHRTRGFSDEVTYSLEGGATVVDRIGLMVRARGVESLKNGRDEPLGGPVGLYANDVRYLAVGGEVTYTLPSGVGVALGAETALFGQNTLSAPVFSLGVFLQR